MEKKYILDLGDLISNLFIILMESKIDTDKITDNQIEQFRKILEKEAENKEINLLFNLSRNETIKFFNNNDTFEKLDDEVILKEGVTPIHLIWNYRLNLPIDVLQLISSERVIDEILNIMGYKNKEKSIENIEYFINKLKELINIYAENMEFEKCIELRDKLYELQSIQKVMDSDKEESNNEKQLQKNKNFNT